MKRYVNVFIALSLVLGAAGMIMFWEIYLDDRVNTVSVVVASRNLEKNQVIRVDDVKLARIKADLVARKPIKKTEDVIGVETSQFVARGNQIVEEMIDRYGLEPNHDQLIYSIPKEWIYSSPGSLRRKDRVYIYAMPTEKSSNAINGNVGVPDQDPPGRKTTFKPILKDIVVAFAKDSANQEVKPATNSDKRIDATGSISNIELVMSQDQYFLLEQKYLDGSGYLLDKQRESSRESSSSFHRENKKHRDGNIKYANRCRD